MKAYIIYGGKPEWYNATLIFENGWAPFGHLCSHPCFMPGDLLLHRPERQAVLARMGITTEIIGEPFAGTDNPLLPEGLIALHEAGAWQSMADEYGRIDKELNRNKP